MNTSDRGGMGLKKHRKSGKASKSPRFRLLRELDLRKAEKETKRPKAEMIDASEFKSLFEDK